MQVRALLILACVCFATLCNAQETIFLVRDTGRVDSLYDAYLDAWNARHKARVDSLRAVQMETWMPKRTDGGIHTGMTPPLNLANGGITLRSAGLYQRDKLILRIASTLAGGALWFANKNVGYAVAGAGWTYSLVLDFRQAKDTEEAGRMIQSGYSINTLYDLVDDKVDDGPREFLIIRRFRRVMK